jgi:hypothetical protein
LTLKGRGVDPASNILKYILSGFESIKLWLRKIRFFIRHLKVQSKSGLKISDQQNENCYNGTRGAGGAEKAVFYSKNLR